MLTGLKLSSFLIAFEEEDDAKEGLENSCEFSKSWP